MAARHVLSLCLILAFTWCEQTRAFSPQFSRATTILPSTSSSVVNNANDEKRMGSRAESLNGQTSVFAMSRSARTQLKRDTRMAMTMDGSSDDSSGENKEATTKEDTENETSSGTQKSNVILVVPLFCKFMVVLLIKFLTDLVVYPSLLLYRLARRTKQKLFGSFSASYKANGSTQ